MTEELDLFSFSMPKFKIDKPIRLIELFAGIGAQAKALENLGVPFEHHFVCEIDRYAIASYNAIHGTNFETKDITQVHASDLKIEERESYCYITTYSFPCQDLSLAGNQKGMAKGDNTRSGLLWEVERILDECDELPQVLLMENVPQVIGKKNIKDFQLWRKKLESLGYSNYVQLLNSKDHGIPQNRNRCFMVSVLGDYHYSFPKKKKLELKMKDLLEENVDEKYYLSDEVIQKFIAYNKRQEENGNGFRFEAFERERVGKTVQTKTDRADCNYIISGGGLSKTEQVNTSQTKCMTTKMSGHDVFRRQTTNDRSRLSKAIRTSGRGSTDRHMWDIVNEEIQDT